jgi:hypothetical protein
MTKLIIEKYIQRIVQLGKYNIFQWVEYRYIFHGFMNFHLNFFDFFWFLATFQLDDLASLPFTYLVGNIFLNE